MEFSNQRRAIPRAGFRVFFTLPNCLRELLASFSAGSARCKGRTSSLTSDRAGSVMASVPAAWADGPCEDDGRAGKAPMRAHQNGFLEQTFLDFARQVRPETKGAGADHLCESYRVLAHEHRPAAALQQPRFTGYLVLLLSKDDLSASPAPRHRDGDRPRRPRTTPPRLQAILKPRPKMPR